MGNKTSNTAKNINKNISNPIVYTKRGLDEIKIFEQRKLKYHYDENEIEGEVCDFGFIFRIETQEEFDLATKVMEAKEKYYRVQSKAMRKSSSGEYTYEIVINTINLPNVCETLICKAHLLNNSQNLELVSHCNHVYACI